MRAQNQGRSRCKRIVPWVQQLAIQNASESAKNRAVAWWIANMTGIEHITTTETSSLKITNPSQPQTSAAARWNGGRAGVEFCSGTEDFLAQCFPNQLALQMATLAHRHSSGRDAKIPYLHNEKALDGCEADALIVGCIPGSKSLSPACKPSPINPNLDSPPGVAVIEMSGRSKATGNDPIKWALCPPQQKCEYSY